MVFSKKLSARSICIHGGLSLKPLLKRPAVFRGGRVSFGGLALVYGLLGLLEFLLVEP